VLASLLESGVQFVVVAPQHSGVGIGGQDGADRGRSTGGPGYAGPGQIAGLSGWLAWSTCVLYIYRLVCVRMTGPLQRVLRAFLEDLPAPRYGYDLMRAAGVKSGTLYPLLGRLEEDGLVSSGWAVPQMAGQRPRRYYRLTGEGATVARVELARLSAGGRAPARPGRPAPGSLG
jgi:PadR family transcriptional regulator, regulatory protein PadR